MAVSFKPQSRAGGDLPAAPGGPVQQEVGDVGAHDQQHEGGGAEQQGEGLAQAADHRLVERHQAGAAGQVLAAVLLAQLGREGGELGVSAVNRHPGCQPCHRQDVVHAAHLGPRSLSRRAHTETADHEQLLSGLSPR